MSLSSFGTTKPKIIGCVDTKLCLANQLRGSSTRPQHCYQRADVPGPSTNVGYLRRKEKHHDSTAAATADKGIRAATRQRLRHAPRRASGARHHHCDCDLPKRIRPAGLDFRLTMAARAWRCLVVEMHKIWMVGIFGIETGRHRLLSLLPEWRLQLDQVLCRRLPGVPPCNESTSMEALNR